MSLSTASTSLTTAYLNAASASNSNQTSLSTNSDLRNVNSRVGSSYSSLTDSSANDITTSSNALNSHHTTSQNLSYSTSPLTNDVWMSQMNLPNLTDAILESDIFYPLVCLSLNCLHNKFSSLYLLFTYNLIYAST